MRIVQVKTSRGVRAAVVESPIQLRLIDYPGGTYELAQAALAAGTSLIEFIECHRSHELLDYHQTLDMGLLLPPVTHPDPAHCYVTGTGLTHLGSADTRSAMHAKAKVSDDELTDSMRMFNLGVEGGKPRPGKEGAQPEWFYKGDGSIVVAPESPFAVPHFAQDAGEEPELVGIYINADDGTPFRLGYAVGNEFSDHVTERANYLWLAHSKLRACSFGPELLLGELPDHLEAQAVSFAQARRYGKSRFSPAKPTWHTACPIWNITTLNIHSFVNQAMCMCIISALPHSALRTESAYKTATALKLSYLLLAVLCAILSSSWKTNL